MLELSFTSVNMHLRQNSMKRMVLSCHKEPFVCIVRKFEFRDERWNIKLEDNPTNDSQ